MIKPMLITAFGTAALAARNAGRLQYETLPAFTVERPGNPAFGDLTVNLAMLLAGAAKLPPRQAAQVLIDYLQLPDTLIDRIEITGPGFINLFLKATWLHGIIQEIHLQGDDYGASNVGQGKRVLVEFVSANPNGPLSITHGRSAVIGDVLSAALHKVGYTVTREFYVNDAATSTQMVRFGESLVVHYLRELRQTIEFPDDGYQGEYMTTFAREIIARDGDMYLHMPAAKRLELFTTLGKEAMIAWQRAVLAGIGVTFDNWFSEQALFAEGEVGQTMQALVEHGATYEAERATWLASTRFGDEKDRPLVRSNGKPTYLASDIAYHRNKFERGYAILIDIWGSDHHGYIARTKAAMAALGYDPEQVRVLVYQGVRLLRNGECVAGGSQKDSIELLSDLVEYLGNDAARFYYLLRGPDSELNFDLDLAKTASPDNPLYFVQHAHARIAGILRTAMEQDVALPDPRTTDLTPLAHEAEVALIRRLGDFPEEILTATELYEPHRLTRYAQEMAREFHTFYTRCPVLKDGTPPEVRDARLLLVGAAKITLKNVLTLLGVGAPERM